MPASGAPSGLVATPAATPTSANRDPVVAEQEIWLVVIGDIEIGVAIVIVVGESHA